MGQLDSTDGSNPTLYNMAGCPKDLFMYMVRLGDYSREFELAFAMKYVEFDVELVLAAEKGIREWSVPQMDDSNLLTDPEEAHELDGLAQQRQDKIHCAEAWRYGLLVYIQKVFKWRKNKGFPLLLGFLARKTLDNVRSCRKTSMLQKQLLLPVFLAGCETKEDHLQQEVRDYCKWWNEETRYDMFLTAISLLEEVWATQDVDCWWGSVIDQSTRAKVNSDIRQYLFG